MLFVFLHFEKRKAVENGKRQTSQILTFKGFLQSVVLIISIYFSDPKIDGQVLFSLSFLILSATKWSVEFLMLKLLDY